MDDIFIRYYEMPASIRGYTVSNSDGSYTIVINSVMSNEMQKETYEHELNHINIGDFERKCNVNLLEINAHGWA